MKLRGTTGFTFRSSLRPETLLQSIQAILDRYAAADPRVERATVTFDGKSAIRIELVIAAPTFGEGDAAIDSLADDLKQRFTPEGSSLGIDDRLTELVPA